jgi:hypothetical protein
MWRGSALFMAENTVNAADGVDVDKVLSLIWNRAFWYGVEFGRSERTVMDPKFDENTRRAKQRHISKVTGKKIKVSRYGFLS